LLIHDSFLLNEYVLVMSLVMNQMRCQNFCCLLEKNSWSSSCERRHSAKLDVKMSVQQLLVVRMLLMLAHRRANAWIERKARFFVVLADWSVLVEGISSA
jgi:hypothetical protein